MNMTTLSPEQKFGIKLRGRPGPRTLDQSWSLLIGIVAIVLGIIGFVMMGFTNYTEMSDHYIFGLLQWNGFHSTIFIICGLLWLTGAFALSPAGNGGVNIALGIIFLILAVLGFMGYWGLLSIPAGINGDNILNLVVAIVSLLIGVGAGSGGNQEAA